jgi:hypothetical protein
MRKKITSIGTLLCFSFLNVSCTSVKVMKIEKETDMPKESATITGIQKKSGEYMKFPKGRRGRIEGDFVKGLIDSQSLVLNRTDFKYIEEHWENRVKKYSMIKTIDGETYKVFAAEENGNSVRLRVQSMASFPLSEVKLLWVKAFDPWRTFIAVICGAVPMAVLAILGLAPLG